MDDLALIQPTDEDWRRITSMPDRVVFHTPEWLRYVASTQHAEPVVAAVLRDGERVGYFLGLVVKRFGLRILGSPFPGWTTPSMGFTLDAGVSRRAAAAALPALAFGPLKCVHVELVDRWLTPQDAAGLGYETDVHMTLEVDLTGDEDAIFGRMTSACRRAVRKAEKSGVTVEVAQGVGFAEEFHEQLTGVFARQGLVPTYDVERVRELIRCLEPAGMLLMLRCRAEDGRSIATGLFPAFGRSAYFWGGASLRQDQILRPNEAIFWAAIRHWRERGIQAFDLAGPNDYKRKYGGVEVFLPSCTRSRFAGLSSMRSLAEAAVKTRQRWQGRKLAPAGAAGGEAD
jgi:CelD/BcsL family acetyltransferase involved in cellulose biosynthesis